MPDAQLLTISEILKIYRPIDTFAHKGTQGHALIVGGSYGKIGAVCLSSKAALRSGCGLVTAFVPKCGYEIVQISVPEAMTVTDAAFNKITRIRVKIQPNAIGIGPGMGTKKRTQKGFHRFLLKNKVPLVVDADGLNILSENKDWISLLKPNTILTPHKKELERLIGAFSSEDEYIKAAIDFAAKHDVIVVLKGAPTIIFGNGTVFRNTTGNPALATAGSGDVLTGIITGLLAQRYEPIDAAKIGVFLHGLAADNAVADFAEASFIASDVIRNLSSAFLVLRNK